MLFIYIKYIIFYIYRQHSLICKQRSVYILPACKHWIVSMAFCKHFWSGFSTSFWSFLTRALIH